MRNHKYLFSLIIAVSMFVSACGSGSSSETTVTLPEGAESEDDQSASDETDPEATLPVPETVPTEDDEADSDGDEESSEGGDEAADDDAGSDDAGSDESGSDDDADDANSADTDDQSTDDDADDGDDDDNSDGDTDEDEQEPVSNDVNQLSGVISAEGDGAIPEGAEVVVRLVDVSRQDVGGLVITSVIYNNVSSFPIDYVLTWDEDLGDGKLHAVMAWIYLDDELIYATEEIVDVAPNEPTADFTVVPVP